MKHIIMFSGGIASWATAKHVIDTHGPADTALLFADVGGNHTNPHAAEDEDTYRFIHEAAQQLGAPLIILNQGETIWDVFERRKYLGNSRQANCSIELKQKPARTWLDTHCDPADTTVYIEPPYLSKQHMLDMCRQTGVQPPRLYDIGAAHNNCGGGCVRAGKGTFLKLLTWNPDRYTYWETQEQALRDKLGKDVSILRDWKNGAIPLPLSELRAQATNDQLSLFDDEFDIGGCGCFTSYEPETTLT